MALALLMIAPALALAAPAPLPQDDGAETLRAQQALAALLGAQPGEAPSIQGTPIAELDWPFWVDEDGDSMTGDLAFAGGAGVAFPAGRLTGDVATGLRFGSLAVCLANQAAAGCGGGDITAVNAGFGLSGGAASGDAMLAANPAVLQQRVTGTCAVGSYVRAIAQDGTVTCSPDANSGGTVTSVASGAGLTGGPITGSGTLSIAPGGVTGAMVAAATITSADVDPNTVQWAVTGSCLVGSAIRVINSDGTVFCQDTPGGDITSVIAGPGLTGGATTADAQLSADPTYLQRRVTGQCAVGQYVRVVAEDGGVTCGTDADTDTQYGAGDGLSLSGTTFSIAAGGIRNEMLAADAVDTFKIADGTIDFDDIGNNGCTAGSIMKQDAIQWVCAFDEVDGGDAATLGGLGAGAFLRRDADDTFTGPVLTIAGGSRLDVLGDLRVGTDSATDDDLLYFDEAVTPESIGWADANSRFEISDEAAFKGAILTGGTTQTYAYNRFGCCTGDPLPDINSASDLFVVSDTELGGKAFVDKDVYVNADGPEGDASVYFFNAGLNTGESVAWNDLDDRFVVSDATLLQGAFRTSLPGGLDMSPKAYNVLGGQARDPVSAALGTPADLYIQNALEVGSQLYANGTVFMKGQASAGGDADQFLYFYNSGSRIGESLSWDETEDRFQFTDGLLLTGPLDVGLVGDLAVGYNRMASSSVNVPTSSQMNTAGDLYVQFDQEVGDELFLNDTLYMLGSAAAGQDRTQNIYFYNAGSRLGESFAWDDADDRFEFSDDLLTTGPVQIGTAAQQAYNRIGAAALAPEANIGNLADLMISDSLQIGGTAYKPGGGSWTATSDARLKRDVHAYEDGLAMLRGVEPVWYTYNGLGGTPEGMTAVGVLAQDLQTVAPYMVGSFLAPLRPGDEPTTLYHVDPSAFTFASINAIQELDGVAQDQDARITALEGQLAAERSENDQLEARLAALEALVARLAAS